MTPTPDDARRLALEAKDCARRGDHWLSTYYTPNALAALADALLASLDECEWRKEESDKAETYHAAEVDELQAECERLRAALSGLLSIVDDGHCRTGPNSPIWGEVSAARKELEDKTNG